MQSHKKDFINKVCIVTGSSRGLGFHIAKKFYEFGSHVILVSRNIDELKKAKEKIQKKNKKTNQIYILSGDISQKTFTDKVIKKTLYKFKKIDFLINNAGIYGPIGKIHTTKYSDIVDAININVMGSLNMCLAVIPHMKKRRKGKIIQIAGGGATKPIKNFSIYSLTKAAIVRFNETIAHELISYNININSVSPGFLKTKMTDDVIQAGKRKVGKEYYDRNILQKKLGGDGFERACNLIIFLCSSRASHIYGKIISAIWDNWHLFSKYKNISKNDVFTLRRIIGKERNYNKLDK